GRRLVAAAASVRPVARDGDDAPRRGPGEAAVARDLKHESGGAGARRTVERTARRVRARREDIQDHERLRIRWIVEGQDVELGSEARRAGEHSLESERVERAGAEIAAQVNGADADAG